MKNKKTMVAIGIAALLLAPIVLAAPTSSPPTGNVTPTFSGLKITGAAGDLLVLSATASNVSITAPRPGESIWIADPEGMDVRGPVFNWQNPLVLGNVAKGDKSINVVTRLENSVGDLHLSDSVKIGTSTDNDYLLIGSNGDISDNGGAVRVIDADGLSVESPLLGGYRSPLRINEHSGITKYFDHADGDTSISINSTVTEREKCNDGGGIVTGTGANTKCKTFLNISSGIFSLGVDESDPSIMFDTARASISGNESMDLLLDDNVNITGNVGIGTDDPKRRLHINSGTTNENFRLQGTDHSISEIKAPDNSERSFRILNDSDTLRWLIGTDNLPESTYNDFVIKKANNGTPEFIIDRATSNVGIGTDDPKRRLHVNSGTTFENFRLQGTNHSISEIKAPDNSERSFRILNDSDALSWLIGTDNAPASTYNDFVIKKENNGTPEFVIDRDTGNVGIGTATPNSKLHVNGSFTATSINGLSTSTEFKSAVNPTDDYRLCVITREQVVIKFHMCAPPLVGTCSSSTTELYWTCLQKA
jgi:hypothetical protein